MFPIQNNQYYIWKDLNEKQLLVGFCAWFPKIQSLSFCYKWESVRKIKTLFLYFHSKLYPNLIEVQNLPPKVTCMWKAPEFTSQNSVFCPKLPTTVRPSRKILFPSKISMSNHGMGLTEVICCNRDGVTLWAAASNPPNLVGQAGPLELLSSLLVWVV